MARLEYPSERSDDMLSELTCTCAGDGCDRELDTADRRIVYETDVGTRHVYECDCGAVTITVRR